MEKWIILHSIITFILVIQMYLHIQYVGRYVPAICTDSVGLSEWI